LCIKIEYGCIKATFISYVGLNWCTKISFLRNRMGKWFKRSQAPFDCRTMCQNGQYTQHLDVFTDLITLFVIKVEWLSTETTDLFTALPHVKNYKLCSSNDQEAMALISFDLSAAFDTVVHNILLTRLEQYETYRVWNST